MRNNRYNKVEMLMNTSILAIVVLVIAIFFWPSNEEKVQSNPKDASKTQIEVLLKRINIRKEPDVNSQDIGDVYKGEIYTVLEDIKTEYYDWYKITTNQGITGYIASEPGIDYVKLISGYIDRTPPKIELEKNFLLFLNGEVSLDDVICTDEYSTCTLTYEKENAQYLTITGTDEKGNSSSIKARYYDVYPSYSSYSESSPNLNAIFRKTQKEDKMTISAIYQLNRKILSENKSIHYTPLITFYDENFQEIHDILVEYNTEETESNCINNSQFELKEEYLDSNLQVNHSLCMNYTFKSNQAKVRYFAVGFTGVENYMKDENYFANYYSKYYIY